MSKRPKRSPGAQKNRKLSATQLQQEVLQLFKQHPKKHFNPRQVMQVLKLDNNKDSIQHALNTLVETRALVPLEDYKFKLRTDSPPSHQYNDYEGYIDMTRTGSAYVTCDQLHEDVHVAAKYMHGALHGDRVRLRVWKPPGRTRPEGQVLEVLERASTHFVGTLWMHHRYAIVSPEMKVPLDIYVDLAHTKGAKDGDKVIVKITQYETNRFSTLEGIVTAVLGQAGSHDIEMKAILINNGFDLEFSDEALQEAAEIPEHIDATEYQRRLDMRAITTFTIDPFNAKDFDDALSIRYLESEEGFIEVGVHIADVTHYLKPGGPLDKEAYRRSTSVYLVDRVLPMLPEKLSNELCSLRPHEDKLTFSAVFVFDKSYKIVRRWFGKTIIHSDRRFTYEEVQAILDSGQGDFAEELKCLNQIARKLRKERFKKGAINFETPEVQFRLAPDGAPVEVFVKERKEAHMLIEDFMLLANREVATFIYQKGKNQEIPFVYRVHDEPNPEKLEEFALFARQFGINMDISSPAAIARSFNRLVEAAAKESTLKLLEQPAIRTMAKAVYSTDNIGHYGLAFTHYCHFTSPIRRYSDVLVHRILEQNLPADAFFRMKKDKLEEQCKHISLQERKAMEAERESVRYKQTEYMEKHLGQEFDGVVSGLSERGLFITLVDTLCEGMVSFDSLGEPFRTLQSKLSAKGVFSGRQFKTGDVVRVRVVRTDLSRRVIDLELVEEKPRR